MVFLISGVCLWNQTSEGIFKLITKVEGCRNDTLTLLKCCGECDIAKLSCLWPVGTAGV